MHGRNCGDRVSGQCGRQWCPGCAYRGPAISERRHYALYRRIGGAMRKNQLQNWCIRAAPGLKPICLASQRGPEGPLFHGSGSSNCVIVIGKYLLLLAALACAPLVVATSM